MRDRLQAILDNYVEERRYVEDEKPEWLNLRGGTASSGELRFEAETYFPEAHYSKAIARELERQAEMEPDGGFENLHTDGRRSTVFYWLNPETGAALYHTEANEREANPFFASLGEAESYLESRASGEQDRYEGLSLYRAKVEKVEDAVEVLLDQSGIDDFW